MRNLIAVIALVFTFLSTTKAQFIVMPDNYRLDTTVVYHETMSPQIGDSLHVVGYNNFMKVEIDIVFTDYSGTKNLIGQDKAGYLWLVKRGKENGWYYYELVDLENLDYRIRYYYTQRF